MLNTFSVQAPKYGTLLVLNRDGKVEYKDLTEVEYCPIVNNYVSNHNLRSTYKILPYYYTLDELIEMKGKGWNNEVITEIFDKYKGMSKQGPSSVPNIRIVESYLRLPKSMFEEVKDEDDSYNLYKVIATLDGNYYGQLKTLTSNQRPLGLERLLYWKEIKEDLKIKKFDFTSFIGRNFGEGYIESTQDGQEKVNELHGQLSNKLRISSKTILQSRDATIEKNVFTDYDDGEIIQTELSDLKQVDLSVHDLSNYMSIINDTVNNMRLNTSGSEILFGETLPSDTPYRLGALMQQQGSKMFEFIRERLGVFISEIVMEWVMPELLKEIKKEEHLYIKDPDTWNEIMDIYINNEISNAVIQYAITKGVMPSDKEIKAERTKLEKKYKDQSERLLPKLAEDYFDFDYDVTCNITGEKGNIQAETETLINLVNQIGQNPGILTNPATLEMLKKIAENTHLDKGMLQLGAQKYKDLIVASKQNNNPELAANQMGASAGVTPEAGRNQSMATGGIESMQLTQ